MALRIGTVQVPASFRAPRQIFGLSETNLEARAAVPAEPHRLNPAPSGPSSAPLPTFAALGFLRLPAALAWGTSPACSAIAVSHRDVRSLETGALAELAPAEPFLPRQAVSDI
jgi:hypothetical protein